MFRYVLACTCLFVVYTRACFARTLLYVAACKRRPVELCLHKDFVLAHDAQGEPTADLTTLCQVVPVEGSRGPPRHNNASVLSETFAHCGTNRGRPGHWGTMAALHGSGPETWATLSCDPARFVRYTWPPMQLPHEWRPHTGQFSQIFWRTCVCSKKGLFVVHSSDLFCLSRSGSRLLHLPLTNILVHRQKNVSLCV